MAQTDQPAESAPKTPVVDQAVQPLTLEEFCLRLSSPDRRVGVAIIGGFYSVERLAGHFKDFESAYESRFTAFVNKPA